MPACLTTNQRYLGKVCDKEVLRWIETYTDKKIRGGLCSLPRIKHGFDIPVCVKDGLLSLHSRYVHLNLKFKI